MLNEIQLKELDLLVKEFKGKQLTHYKGGKYLVTGFTLLCTATKGLEKADGEWGIKYCPVVGGVPIFDIEYTRPHWEFKELLTIMLEEGRPETVRVLRFHG